MRTLIISAAATILASAASAQVDRGPATQAFVDMCMDLAGNGLQNPEPTCACGAGVISGQMTDTQYTIMGRLAPFNGDDAGMENEVLRLMDEDGYDPNEIAETGALLVDLQTLIDSTCVVLER